MLKYNLQAISLRFLLYNNKIFEIFYSFGLKLIKKLKIYGKNLLTLLANCVRMGQYE